MAANKITIISTGEDVIAEALIRINPGTNPGWVRRSLVAAGLLVQRNAADKQIRKGGGPVHPRRLTARTGTGARSIAVDRGGLRAFFVEVGSKGAASKYMALHETGGTVNVRAHQRRSRIGNLHSVRAHKATYPARPYLRPALNSLQDEIGDIFADEVFSEVRDL